MSQSISAVQIVGAPRSGSTLLARLLGAVEGCFGKRYRYDGRSAHGLRRTCATDMIHAGAELLDVKEALGHANVQTTMAYVAYDTSRLAKAMGGRRYQPPTSDDRRMFGVG